MPMLRTVTNLLFNLVIIHNLLEKYWKKEIGGLKFKQFIHYSISNGNHSQKALDMIDLGLKLLE